MQYDSEEVKEPIAGDRPDPRPHRHLRINDVLKMMSL
jgi:hypothetical protein